jgi:threonine synthase
MKTFSTRDHEKKQPYSFKDALFSGLAPDGGLYMPEHIPSFSAEEITSLLELDFPSLAGEVAVKLFGDEVDSNELRKMAKEAYTFPVPLKEIYPTSNPGQLDSPNVHPCPILTLELFHGPTYAFKDFAALFMSRLMSALLDTRELASAAEQLTTARLKSPKAVTNLNSSSSQAAPKNLSLLVATSGDTGGAVGNGFLNVPGIDVWILYPKGQVSPLQEQQLTTLGGNVRAIEVDASFDECQAMVKRAFSDPELKEKLRLTTANSINIARLLPQTFYYFWLYSQLVKQGFVDPPANSSEAESSNFSNEILISVPSGNLGNLTAGVIAKKMGLPLRNFIAANNKNAALQNYYESGNYPDGKSTPTISNAMDIAIPSNLERLIELSRRELAAPSPEAILTSMQKEIQAAVISDVDTLDLMRRVKDETGYTLDPHGAVALKALENELKNRTENSPDSGAKAPKVAVFIETAHPVKFNPVMQKAFGAKLPLTEEMQALMKKPKQAMQMKPDFKAFKQLLINNCQ